jgi:hypothetical protein
MAFNECLKGNLKISRFLLAHGFPELSALAAAILSDTEALHWLLNNGYPEFAVLSNAIDNEQHAIAWLEKYQCTFLSMFAAACRKDDQAIRWFAEQKLDLFLFIIRNIHQILLYQSWDSSDVHRIRRS